MPMTAAALEILTDEIKHGGERAEVVVLLYVELQGFSVHV